MIDTAVILAAGMGTRLRGEVDDRPKGFITLGARPIVEESIQRLTRAGLTRIIVVTGHGREHYQRLASRHEGLVSLVCNELYATSGSFYSLSRARGMVQGDFLLLESDIIYEQRALQTLLDGPAQDAVLASGPTGAGDEVWVEVVDGRLTGMSKDRAALRGVAGELVGISRISLALWDRLLALGERLFRSSLELDYETDGLVGAGRDHLVACPVVPDLLWAEIDDPAHLARARDEIWPAIQATEP